MKGARDLAEGRWRSLAASVLVGLLLAPSGSFADEISIEVFDLLPAMASQTSDWGSLFLSCDGHWNAAGHRAAYLAVKDYLDGERPPGP